MTNDDDQLPEVTYADDRVPAGLILRILGAMVGIGFTLCVIAYLLLRAREEQLRPGRHFPDRNLGAPHQVANVRAAPFEIAKPRPALVDEQRWLVDSYGWIDKNRGIVRIPVDREIDLMLREERR